MMPQMSSLFITNELHFGNLATTPKQMIKKIDHQNKQSKELASYSMQNPAPKDHGYLQRAPPL
jgi:hypothetical protein